MVDLVLSRVRADARLRLFGGSVQRVAVCMIVLASIVAAASAVACTKWSGWKWSTFESFFALAVEPLQSQVRFQRHPTPWFGSFSGSFSAPFSFSSCSCASTSRWGSPWSWGLWSSPIATLTVDGAMFVGSQSCCCLRSRMEC